MKLAARVAKVMEEARSGPLNQNQLALLIGMSRSNFTHILSGRTKSIKFETAKKIARNTGFRAEWIFDGSSPEKDGEPAAEQTTDGDDDRFRDVRGYPHAMGLGASREVTDEYVEANRLKFRADSLRKKGLHARRLAVWECKGDSMLPNVKDGDAVMFDEEDTIPKDGELYVIRIGPREHHLKRALILDGVIYFAADNPEGDHAWKKPRRADDRRNPIIVVGRAWWIGRWLA